jgi:hypothetical protein
VAQAKAKETISKMLLPRDIETGREKREGERGSQQRGEEERGKDLISPPESGTAVVLLLLELPELC